MKKCVLAFVAVCCAALGTEAAAQPAMYAPWQCGTTQVVTQGNWGEVSHHPIGLPYSDTYAWDIGMNEGTPVVAPADGTVGFVHAGETLGWCSDAAANYANYVQICYDGDYAGIFWHLSQVYVTLGQHVKQGDVIGLSGSTGYSCGAHLHYAVTYCSQWYNSRPATWAGIGNPVSWQTVVSNNCPTGGGQESGGQQGGGQQSSTIGNNDDILLMAMEYDPQNTDVNGDGKSDICVRASDGYYCALSNGKGFDQHKNMLNILKNDYGWTDKNASSTIRLADINGDKKADICVRSDDGIDCWLSDGNTFATKTATLTSLSNTNGYNSIEYLSAIRFADINGDGKDDVCARMKDKFRCYLSNGNGFDTEVSINDLGDDVKWNYLQYGSTIRMADVDGDGKMDMCARGYDTVYCWFSNGTSWSDEVKMQTENTAMSDPGGWNGDKFYPTIRFADINGDGKADICGHDILGIRCTLSKGRSGFDTNLIRLGWTHENGWGAKEHYLGVIYGDFNGDGKDDVCGRAMNGLNCHLSKGDSFDGKAYIISAFSNEKGFDKPEHYMTLRMGDMDGDGKMEICGRGVEKVSCYTFTGSDFKEVSGGKLTWSDKDGWNDISVYPTIRFGGKGEAPACKPSTEICDSIDNDCDGLVDEDDVCKIEDTEPSCTDVIMPDGSCCKPSKEVCDGKDNDCDGQIDEGNVCQGGTMRDECPDIVMPDGSCCKPSTEVCDNADNDCDGLVDEDDVCKVDVPDDCVPSKEVCDDIDNNCDGEIDEGGVCDVEVSFDCTPTVEICDGRDNDCDGKIDEGGVCDVEIPNDCDPSDEVCDGKDNDCDGKIDEGGVCEDGCKGSDCEASVTTHIKASSCSIGNGHSNSGMMALFGILSALGMMMFRRRKEN